MLSDIEQIIADCSKFEGICPSLLNKLNPTVTGLNTVQIDTGSALNDGHPYKNSTTVAVNIPSAVGGGNTRIDRIVARCSWAGFTVRIFRIAGTDAASPTVPAIVQTPGTTYDIKICQVLVNTAGTCVVTDERNFAGGATIAWTPTVTGFVTPTILCARYFLIGKLCIAVVNVSGQSNGTGLTITAPFYAIATSGENWFAAADGIDNGLYLTNPACALLQSNSNIINVYSNFALAAWTANGSKQVQFTLIFETA